MDRVRPVARIDCGEVWNTQKVHLLDPKSGLLDLTPLNPPTKTPLLVHFVAESGPFGRSLHPCTPPPAMGLDRVETVGISLSNYAFEVMTL